MKIPTSSRLAILAAIALGMIPLTTNAQVIFGPDGDMSTADWSLGASRVNAGSGYTGTLTDITTGNPDEALNLNISYTASSGSSFVAQFVKRDDWTYTPSLSGPITTIDFSGDFNSNNGIAISVGLLQGGLTYWTHPNVNSGAINSAPYVGVSLTSLIATDFVELQTATGNPDFSSAGSEIIFGYFVRRGDSGTGSRNIDIGADNVAFTVIPEPSSAVLLVGALAGFLALRRRRA